MERLKIAVIAGGLSPERDVSLSSGAKITNTLIKAGHHAVLIDSYLGTELPENIEDIFFGKGEYYYSIPDKAPTIDEIIKLGGGSERTLGKNVLRICRAADIVFVALHGGAGEDGRVQAILEADGIRHTGPGFEGCVLAMDKQIAKQLLLSGDVLTPPGVFFPRGKTTGEAVEEIKRAVGLPCAVKPAGCGSSVGVSLVKKEGELTAAYEYASSFDTGVIVEKLIRGREIQVGMLNGLALPPIEIIPDEGDFYDYKNKYGGTTREVTPAPIPDEETLKIQNITLRVCEILKLTGYSRIDFIREEETGDYYVLEANALPGMTPTSLLPQEAAAAGIDYMQLCEKIAEIAWNNKR